MVRMISLGGGMLHHRRPFLYVSVGRLPSAERDDDMWKERPSNNRDCWAHPNNALGLPIRRCTDGTVRSAGDEFSARGEQTDVRAIVVRMFVGCRPPLCVGSTIELDRRDSMECKWSSLMKYFDP